MKPLISVIIAARNAQNTIGPCLDSILRLRYPSFEVIVADDGSTDRSAAILAGYSTAIEVLSLPHGGPSRARNTALKKARGEYAAFTDSDCIVSPDWLDELIRCFEDRTVAAAGGSQKSPEDETDFGKRVQRFFAETGFIGDYAKQRKGIYETAHNPSCNSMYRISELRRIGGFWEGVWPGEDVEVDLLLRRSGSCILFNSDAVVYHYRQKTMSGFCRMMSHYGRAQAVLVKRYGIFRFIQVVPVLSLFFGIICIMRPAVALFVFAGLCAAALMKRVSSSTIRLLLPAFLHWHAGFAKGLFCSMPPRAVNL